MIEMPLLVLAGAVILASSIWWSTSRFRESGRHQGAKSAQSTLIYTNHVRERMRQRGVTQAEIELVLGSPMRQTACVADHSVRFERQISGRVLKVWVVDDYVDANRMVIKTTAWNDFSELVQVPADKMGLIIGRKGATINHLRNEFGVRITAEGPAAWRITSENGDNVRVAAQAVRTIVATASKRGVCPSVR